MNITCKYYYSKCYLHGICEFGYDCRECRDYAEKPKRPNVIDDDCERRQTAVCMFSKNYKAFEYQEGYGLQTGNRFIRDDDIDYLKIGKEVLKGDEE